MKLFYLILYTFIGANNIMFYVLLYYALFVLKEYVFSNKCIAPVSLISVL